MSSTNVFEAAAAGDTEYLKQNLKNLGAQNERGWTALHFAARYGQRHAIEFLLKKGIDKTTANSEGKTAAQVAQSWGYEDIAKLLGSGSSSSSDNNSNTESSSMTGFPTNRVNFFAGSPLNRYSWFRTDTVMLRKLLMSPLSKYVLLNNLDPLFDANGFCLASYEEVAPILNKLLPDDQEEESTSAEDEIVLVFLGIDEREGRVDQGIPYWALDVTPRGYHKETMEQLAKELKAREADFAPALPRALTLDRDVASILGQARAMVDWNVRHMYCPACGRRTTSKEAGHKRACPPDANTETPCISHKGVHNFAYPRTDPVVIVAVVHPTEDKILLGRQKRWPGRMYSCIAGFVEAGESVEEAVRREVYEETGIRADRVAYHSSQPWPFPNSLMFGFIAEAVTTDIKLEDKELDKAEWFSFTDVQTVLHGQEGPFTMPSENAIAYQLVKSWATEKVWRIKSSNAKM